MYQAVHTNSTYKTRVTVTRVIVTAVFFTTVRIFKKTLFDCQVQFDNRF